MTKNNQNKPRFVGAFSELFNDGISGGVEESELLSVCKLMDDALEHKNGKEIGNIWMLMKQAIAKAEGQA